MSDETREKLREIEDIARELMLKLDRPETQETGEWGLAEMILRRVRALLEAEEEGGADLITDHEYREDPGPGNACLICDGARTAHAPQPEPEEGPGIKWLTVKEDRAERDEGGEDEDARLIRRLICATERAEALSRRLEHPWTPTRAEEAIEARDDIAAELLARLRSRPSEEAGLDRAIKALEAIKDSTYPPTMRKIATQALESLRTKEGEDGAR